MKRLCAFAISHIVTHYYAATHPAAWSVALPVCHTIEPSVNGNDAPYVKLLSPLVIFGHAHLDSRTDIQALLAEYCIVGIPQNTAI